MGQRDLRRLLITGAMIVVRHAARRGGTADPRPARMLARKPRMLWLRWPWPAFAPKQNMDPAIAVAHPGLGDLPDAFLKAACDARRER